MSSGRFQIQELQRGTVIIPPPSGAIAPEEQCHRLLLTIDAWLHSLMHSSVLFLFVVNGKHVPCGESYDFLQILLTHLLKPDTFFSPALYKHKSYSFDMIRLSVTMQATT